jgi:AraC family transcriptional regulator
MPIAHSAAATQPILHRCGTHQRVVLSGIEVVREGRVEPFVYARPTRTSATVCWSGVALENYSNAPVIVPRHEHLEHFVHLVLRGSVKYEVLTGGKTLRYQSGPGTTFILPRGTIDELRWGGPTERIAVAIHPSLLSSALDETIGRTDIEMIEHWNLTDRHIMAVLLAMTTDLDEGSPAGRLYGDSLANALAVYLLTRYTTRRYAPERHRGALPRYLLKRVLDHIDEHLAADISLTQLATVAGMSAHYFAELFRQSTGHAPYQYVLLRKIERAKRSLRHPQRSVLDAALDAGFQNPSHFARTFRRFVGVSPSQFQSERY